MGPNLILITPLTHACRWSDHLNIDDQPDEPEPIRFQAGYIDPLPPRANLVILNGQQVTQVIFNGSTDASGNMVASGVRFQANAGTQSYSVQANKEVILASVLPLLPARGLLLMEPEAAPSQPADPAVVGIGPKSVLQPLGISSRLDLPVGYNLQDHVSYSMYWTTPYVRPQLCGDGC